MLTLKTCATKLEFSLRKSTRCPAVKRRLELHVKQQITLDYIANKQREAAARRAEESANKVLKSRTVSKPE
jgi:hypothetical protein